MACPRQITASGARILFEALRSSSADRLSCLQLDFNPIGNAGIQPLPAYLKQRAARRGGGLEELSLRFCGIGLAGCRYPKWHVCSHASACTSTWMWTRLTHPRGESTLKGHMIYFTPLVDPPHSNNSSFPRSAGTKAHMAVVSSCGCRSSLLYRFEKRAYFGYILQ